VWPAVAAWPEFAGFAGLAFAYPENIIIPNRENKISFFISLFLSKNIFDL
jgi:hypothetical protein